MNKKILSLLIAGALSVSVVLADELTLINDTDITEVTADEAIAVNEFTGIVKAVDDKNLTMEVVTEDDTVEVSFIITDKTEKEDITAGDTVTVSTYSELLSRDIKEALSIKPAVADNTSVLNRYIGDVKSVDGNNVVVAVVTEDGEAEVPFVITDNTAVYNISGEKADKVSEGDNVSIYSYSLLLTKDIKEIKVLIVNDEASNNAVYVDRFNKTEMGFISSDGELVLNIEDEKIEEYEGKELLVFYELATMSIPAQTNPTSIVVLNDGEVAGVQSVEISFNIGQSVLNINGNDVEVEKPYVVGTGVTLVPVRVISEAFGAEVNWDGQTKTVVIIHNDNIIAIQIGNNKGFVNNEEEALEEAPQLTETGFTMVPLRFISEALGATVEYDEATQGVTVKM